MGEGIGGFGNEDPSAGRERSGPVPGEEGERRREEEGGGRAGGRVGVLIAAVK